jgi:hypothetical protein
MQLHLNAKIQNALHIIKMDVSVGFSRIFSNEDVSPQKTIIN